MTVVAQNILTLDPPSEGVPDFHLIIYNEKATIIERDFSALSEENAGLGVEVTAEVDPSGAGRTLVFTGRPDLVSGDSTNIVHFRLNDGEGWQDIFYGSLVEGWASQPMDEPKTFTADADELLNARVTDTKVYPAQDPALIARDLVSRLRHPALHFDAALFQSTGTTLEGGFDMPGVPLGEALEVLAQSAEDAGRSFAFGIDGRGYVFFREPTGVVEVLYRPEDVEGFEPLPVQMRGVTTAVYWVMGNAPSVPGWSGTYQPATLAHLSVPDPELHNRYGRIVGRTPDSQSNLWVPDYTVRSSTSTSGFLNTGNATDNNVATQSKRDPAQTTGNGYYQITHDAPEAQPINGVRLRYIMDYNVVPAATIQFQIEMEAQDPNIEQYLYPVVIYNLPYTGTTWNEIDFILTPSEPVYISNYLGIDAGWYERVSDTHTVRWNSAVYVNHIGDFSIIDFAFLRLDTDLLDSAARRELFLPAFEPATITPTRDTPDGLKTFYVAPRPQVRLRLYPGEPIAPAAKFRYSFNEDFHAGTVIDLGTANRDDNGQRLDQIRLGVDRRTQASEVRQIGRVGR